MPIEITTSTIPADAEAVKARLMQSTSRALYNAVLAHVPDAWTNLSEFYRAAIGSLNLTAPPEQFDCMADVYHMLNHLVEAGLVQSRHTTHYEGEGRVVKSNIVEWSLVRGGEL